MSRGVFLCRAITIFALLLQYAAVGDAQAPCPSSRLGDTDEKECGIQRAIVRPTVAGGRLAERDEITWQAGVYTKLSEPPMQICGGSLVTRTVVISAAHCFWSDIEKQLPASNYAVAVGKLYRPWNDMMDNKAQKSDIREIRIPPRFHGPITNFQDDLALLVLATPVKYTAFVGPVCLDFNYDLDKKHLIHGNEGIVAGWGRTDENGEPSPKLQIADLPAVDVDRCYATIEPVFQPAITSDKICAGFTDKGTAVCMGDSGGGLSFPERYPSGIGILIREQHFLRGVVSTAPRAANDNLCNIYTYATFTHVRKHEHFIREVISGASTEVARNLTSSNGTAQTSSPAAPSIAEPVVSTPDLPNPKPTSGTIKTIGTPLSLSENITTPLFSTDEEQNLPNPESTQMTIKTSGLPLLLPGEIKLPLFSTAKKPNQPVTNHESIFINQPGTPFISTDSKPFENQPIPTQNLPAKSIEVKTPQHQTIWSKPTSTYQAGPSVYRPAQSTSTYLQSVPATITTTQTNPDVTFVKHKWHSDSYDYQQYYHPHHYHHNPHYDRSWHDTPYHHW